jgi:hypothetical protein
MECCGKSRTGRFCSNCGKPFAEDGLWALVKLCRTSEKARRSRARAMAVKYPRAAEAAERSAARWKAWGEALEALLNSKEA